MLDCDSRSFKIRAEGIHLTEADVKTKVIMMLAIVCRAQGRCGGASMTRFAECRRRGMSTLLADSETHTLMQLPEWTNFLVLRDPMIAESAYARQAEI